MKPVTARPNPLLELGVTIVAPAAVLMAAGDGGAIGNAGALLLALALPLGWALWQGWAARRFSWLSLVGIASTLLTGGIGLLQLDAHWLAIKEGAVPLAMALVVAASAWTRKPLIQALVFDAALLDAEQLARALAARGTARAFAAALRTATLLLAAVFAAIALASYALARAVVSSPAGSAAFNHELGRLTVLSYPLVALPSMLAMLALVWWLAREARRCSGLGVGELLGGAD